MVITGLDEAHHGPLRPHTGLSVKGEHFSPQLVGSRAKIMSKLVMPIQNVIMVNVYYLLFKIVTTKAFVICNPPFSESLVFWRSGYLMDLLQEDEQQTLFLELFFLFR